MEGHIIIGDDGHFYAAVIIDSEKVHYYTTIPAYKNKLPQSIAKWKKDSTIILLNIFIKDLNRKPKEIIPQQVEQIIREASQVPDSTSAVYDHDDGEYYVIYVYDESKVTPSQAIMLKEAGTE